MNNQVVQPSLYSFLCREPTLVGRAKRSLCSFALHSLVEQGEAPAPTSLLSSSSSLGWVSKGPPHVQPSVPNRAAKKFLAVRDSSEPAGKTPVSHSGRRRAGRACVAGGSYPRWAWTVRKSGALVVRDGGPGSSEVAGRAEIEGDRSRTKVVERGEGSVTLALNVEGVVARDQDDEGCRAE